MRTRHFFTSLQMENGCSDLNEGKYCVKVDSCKWKREYGAMQVTSVENVQANYSRFDCLY